MYELRIKNRSKNDLCSCEATKAVTNKAHKTTSTGFEPRSFASHHIDFMEIMVQMQSKAFFATVYKLLCSCEDHFRLLFCIDINHITTIMSSVHCACTFRFWRKWTCPSRSDPQDQTTAPQQSTRCSLSSAGPMMLVIDQDLMP